VKLERAIPIFLILFCLTVSVSPVIGKAQELQTPESTATRFYAWYMHELNQNSYPLETKREALGQFVTDRLIAEIDAMPKGPDGLDGDYFVDAQEWDQEWETNINVVSSDTQADKCNMVLLLTGPQNPNHKIRLSLVLEDSSWKINKVETA